MRLGFGVTALERSLTTGGCDGIGNYTQALMERLTDHPEIDVFPISYGYALSQLTDGYCAPIRCMRYSPLAAASFVSRLSFPGTRKLRKQLDLIHAPDHLIPNYAGIPVVASIMDAIPLSNPEWVSSTLGGVKNALWKRSVQWASHVITISEYSKQEISKHFNFDERKISVIPLGVDEKWFQPLEISVTQLVLDKYGLPKRYFLVVGTLQPRKNIGRIIDAWRSLPSGIRKEIPLVVAGRAGWLCEDVIEILASCVEKNSLRWLRYLPSDDLFAVLKGATALVFPSLCEGFGLPVVEAFAAGTPVITSNTTSLPEVAGDAALQVNPLDMEDIANAMQLISENQEIANEFIKKGKERALLYSWDKTASMTIDVYKNTLGMV